MILQRCRPIVIQITHSGLDSDPTTAQDHHRLGRVAFEAKRYREAWRAYKAAFHLDPTPARASEVAFAASFATRTSTAMEDLKQWIALERRAAERRGELVSGWTTLELLVDSYQSNARRYEQTNAARESETERLKEEICSLRETLTALETQLQRSRIH